MVRLVTTRRNQSGQYFVLVNGHILGDICSREYMGEGAPWSFFPTYGLPGMVDFAHSTKRECLESIREDVAAGLCDDAITALVVADQVARLLTHLTHPSEKT